MMNFWPVDKHVHSVNSNVTRPIIKVVRVDLVSEATAPGDRFTRSAVAVE